MGFPGDSEIRNLPANAGEVGLIPNPGIPYMLLLLLLLLSRFSCV